MSLTDNIQQEFDTLPADSLSPVRREALESFEKLGLPSARHEEWKYTHIKTKLPEALRMTGATKQAAHSFTPLSLGKDPGVRIVFINGFFSSEQSARPTDSNIIIGSLKSLSSKHKDIFDQYFNKATDLKSENFAALNTAFAQDGAFIFIPKGIQHTAPIYIVHIYDDGASDIFTQSRNLIIAEDNSLVNIVEDFHTPSGERFYNHVSEVFIGQNAEVNYAYLQIENKNSTSINYVEAKLSRDARYHITTVTVDGKLVRNNMNAYMEGENSLATLNGLYLGNDNAHIDSHIMVDHRVPHCDSNQVYKGVLDDESTGVFNGKIFVQKDAQKTNAFQSSKAILLSNEASINAKPQLEIFADDVKCSHGAAIGQISKNELFYLKSRGIDEETSRAILTYAFANDIINAITIPELKEYLDTKLRERLKIEL